MGLVDLNTIQNPAVGLVPSVAWGDQIRDNFEYLASPPTCSLSGVAGGIASAALPTQIDITTENYDTGGMHAAAANQIVIVTAGFYQITMNVNWTSNAAGYRYVDAYNSTTVTVYEMYLVAPANGATTRNGGTRTASLAAGDVIIARGAQTSGGGLNVQVTEMVVRWIGR